MCVTSGRASQSSEALMHDPEPSSCQPLGSLPERHRAIARGPIVFSAPASHHAQAHDAQGPLPAIVEAMPNGASSLLGPMPALSFPVFAHAHAHWDRGRWLRDLRPRGRRDQR